MSNVSKRRDSRCASPARFRLNTRAVEASLEAQPSAKNCCRVRKKRRCSLVCVQTSSVDSFAAGRWRDRARSRRTREERSFRFSPRDRFSAESSSIVCRLPDGFCDLVCGRGITNAITTSVSRLHLVCPPRFRVFSAQACSLHYITRCNSHEKSTWKTVRVRWIFVDFFHFDVRLKLAFFSTSCQPSCDCIFFFSCFYANSCFSGFDWKNRTLVENCVAQSILRRNVLSILLMYFILCVYSKKILQVIDIINMLRHIVCLCDLASSFLYLNSFKGQSKINQTYKSEKNEDTCSFENLSSFKQFYLDESRKNFFYSNLKTSHLH